MIPKPQISAILTAAANVCATTPEKAMCLNLHAERPILARLLTIYECDRMGYSVTNISRGLSISDTDVRLLIAAAKRRHKLGSAFRNKADLVARAVCPSAKEEDLTSETIQKQRPVYTPEDEKRIRQACIAAEIFMQHFGQGSPSHPYGYGYYDN